MKKLMTKLACAVALMLPAASFAYSGNTSSDSYGFSLHDTSTVSIGADWGDLLYNAFKSANGTLSWTLVSTDVGSSFAGTSGNVTDTPGWFGSTTINLGQLNAGDYALTFSGKWDSGNGVRRFPGFVNLKDGDNIFDPTSFVATPVPAVPEPESYAMLLAGLGLMGTIASRRSRRK